MRYYSGFGFWGEKELFSEYLDDNEFCVAGFSYGAQKALIDAVHTHKRVDKLQLLSPAFFSYPKKIITFQLNSFKKDKQKYINNFLNNVKYPSDIDISKYYDAPELYQLEELFSFNWGLIEHLKNLKVEVFIGSEDKIIDVENAVNFFKKYADVYLIKGAGHLLKS